MANPERHLKQEKQPCMSENGQCNYKNQLVWRNVLMGERLTGEKIKTLEGHSSIIGISHEMWYCANIDDSCPKKHLEFPSVTVQCSQIKNNLVQRKTSGPSQEQLSLVLLILRQEVRRLAFFTQP